MKALSYLLIIDHKVEQFAEISGTFDGWFSGLRKVGSIAAGKPLRDDAIPDCWNLWTSIILPSHRKRLIAPFWQMLINLSCALDWYCQGRKPPKNWPVQCRTEHEGSGRSIPLRIADGNSTPLKITWMSCMYTTVERGNFARWGNFEQLLKKHLTLS